MTKHLWLAGFALLSVGLNAQVGINAGQKTDAPQYQEIAKDAVLQVANKQGEHKGVLLPSVSLNSATDQTSITKDGASTVTKGLLVWCDGQGTGADKLAEGYYYWDGAQWVKMEGSSGALEMVEAFDNGINTIDKPGYVLKDRDKLVFGVKPQYVKPGKGAVDLSIGNFEPRQMGPNATGANGMFSLTAGIGTTAKGDASVALGFGTITEDNAIGSLSIGRFNEPANNALFSVGNGGADNDRHTVFMITEYGHVAVGKPSMAAKSNGLEVLSDIQTDGRVVIGKERADQSTEAGKLQVMGDATVADRLAVGKVRAYVSDEAGKLQVNGIATVADRLAVGWDQVNLAAEAGKLQVLGNATVSERLAVGKKQADLSAGAAKLQVQGSIQSDDLKGSKTRLVAVKDDGVLVPANIDQGTLTENLLAGQIAREKQFLPWERIYKGDDRETYTGSAGGKWYKGEHGQWLYQGPAIVKSACVYNDQSQTGHMESITNALARSQVFYIRPRIDEIMRALPYSGKITINITKPYDHIWAGYVGTAYNLFTDRRPGSPATKITIALSNFIYNSNDLKDICQLPVIIAGGRRGTNNSGSVIKEIVGWEPITQYWLKNE